METAFVPAGETREADRSIPRAISLALAGSAILHLSIQYVCLWHVEDLANSSAPLASAAVRLFGTAGGTIMALTAAASILGNIAVGELSHSRYIFALAEGGLVPGILSRVHPRFRTPWVAILASSATVVLLSCGGGFVFLASMTVLAKLLLYS